MADQEQATNTGESGDQTTEQTGDETQGLGEGGIKALNAERDARKAAEKNLAEVQQDQQAALDAAVSKEQENTQAAEARASEAESRLLRYEVAASKGVPVSLVETLQGATAEDLSAQVDALLEWRSEKPADQPNTPRPVMAQGASGATPQLSNAARFAAFAEEQLNG